MINFASLLNQFRMGGGGSSINDLIDQPDVTLDRLLDEDSFVSEYKSGNAKITNYMTYDKFNTLVEYVTKVGPEDNRKRSYKYPLAASDILSSDNSLAIGFFFPESPLFVEEEVSDSEIPETLPPTKADTEMQAEIGSEQKEKEKEKDKSEESELVAEEKDKIKEGQIDAFKPEQNKETLQLSPEPTPIKKKVVKKQVEPLNGKLFSYFNGEVNYTLAGYVCKIFSAFFTKQPATVMEYLLHEQRIGKVLDHIESRSVGQMMVKILTYESKDYINERKNAFELMLKKISTAHEVYVMSNLASPICEVIQKVAAGVKNSAQNSQQLSSIYFTPNVITQVIINVMAEDESVCVYNAPILMTYLSNVPLVIPENGQLIEDLKLLLISFTESALEKLKVTRESRQNLGFGRVKIVEVISYVLKENILHAQDIAAKKSSFFPVFFSLCKNYQLNNVLHNQVVNIVDVGLKSPESSAFLASMLRDEALLQFLMEETNEDMKIRAGNGSQKVRKGYIGHIVQICRKIQAASLNNSLIRSFAEKKQFDFVIENLVNKEVYEYNKFLAGYGINKDAEHPISFAKQSIIEQHIKFLVNCPSPVYENEPEPVNIEHPDLLQAQAIEALSAEEGVVIERIMKLDISAEQKIDLIDPKFWVNHLQYNLNDLMDDL